MLIPPVESVITDYIITPQYIVDNPSYTEVLYVVRSLSATVLPICSEWIGKGIYVCICWVTRTEIEESNRTAGQQRRGRADKNLVLSRSSP
jgi:hypothetical protein